MAPYFWFFFFFSWWISGRRQWKIGDVRSRLAAFYLLKELSGEFGCLCGAGSRKKEPPAVVLSSPPAGWNMPRRVNDSEALRLFFWCFLSGFEWCKDCARAATAGELERVPSVTEWPASVFLLMLTIMDSLQKDNDNWRSSKSPAAQEQQLTCWLTGKFRLIFFTC